MKTNGLSREQAAQAFQLTSQKRIDLASAIAEIKGGLPSLPDERTTPEPGAPVLPENDEASPILSFAKSINQVTDLARRKRNQSSVEIMAPFRGTVQASDFNSILGNLNAASDKRASDLTDQALKLQEDSDELVSISDLFELNADRPAGQKIPFGITTKELAAMGITPTKSTAKSDDDRQGEYQDEFSAAEEYVAANPEMSAAELKRELRKGSTKLTDSDINSIVDPAVGGRAPADADLTSIAENLISQFLTPAFWSGRTGELNTAKTKAKNLVRQTRSLEVGGKTVKIDPDKWDAIVDAITSDRETAERLLEFKASQEEI